MNLVAALRPGSGFSPRQILALIGQLPVESRTFSSMRGGAQFRGWGGDRYLLAQIVDAVQQQTFAFVAANSKRKPTPPKPMPRPGATTPRRPGNDNGSFAALVARQMKAVRQAKGD